MANKKITDLTELTTPASDDVLPIVDISETSNANKNKKIKVVNLIENLTDVDLKLANGTEAAPSLAFTSATSTGLYRSAANELSITTNGGRAIKVESNNKTTIYGDLVVTGGTTTISSTQIDVTDKNLQLATGNSSDAGADGGGLTLKGASDKTWNWVDSTDAWTANQHIDVATGKAYKIAGTEVLNATTLGAGIVNSSLTSVGTLGALTVTNAVTAGSLDISGGADIDGTLEADAYTVNGTALNEYIADTVGAMVSSNTETNIVVTYNDSDNTLDFVISSYPAASISGTTLASNVVTSSLTSVGTLGLLNVTNTVTANLFSGSGASLTALNADNISSGTLASARIEDNAITRNKISDGEVISSKLDSSAVTTSKINNGAVTNDKVSASAAIAGTKISPNFGSQNVDTSGSVACGNITIANVNPKIFLTDTNNNSDYSILNNNGVFNIKDDTNTATRFYIEADGSANFTGNLDCEAGLDVTGAITSTGNLTVTNTQPKISFVDTNNNDDFELMNADGIFQIVDATNSAYRFRVYSDGTVEAPGNLDVGAGLDVTGNITTNDHISLEGANNQSHPYIEFHSNTANVKKYRIMNGQGWNPDALLIYDVDADNTRLTIEPNGLGINRGSNSISHGLDVGGTAIIRGNSEIQGNLTISGTVDGRDVAADGTKLDTYAANGSSYLRSDADDSFTGTITATSDTTNPVLLIKGIGPNFIRFDSGDDPSVSSDSIDLIYRANPNTLGFERVSDSQTLFSVDADTAVFTIQGNLDANNGIDTTNITVTGTVDGVDIATRDTLFGGLTSSSGVLTNGVTATTQSASDNSTKVATTAYTDTAISNLIDSSPGTLNTLNELAAALGDDANFSTTVTNSIATKLPLAGGTLTGDTTLANTKKVIFNHSSGAGAFIKHQSGHFEIISSVGNTYFASAGTLYLRTNGSTNALTLDTSQNATFAGSLSLPYGTISLGTADSSSGHLNAYEVMTFNIDTDNDDTNRYFAFYKNGASGSGTELFKIEESGTVLVNNRLQLTGPSIYDKSGTGNSVGIQLSSQGVLPTNGSGTEVNNSKNLGSSSYKWAQVHATTFHGSGASLTSLNASNLSSGTVATARLGSGTASSSVYLRGDGTWAAVSAGAATSLDGLTSSQFLRSDTSDSFTGAQFELSHGGNGNPFVINGSADEKFTLSGSSNPYFRLKEGSANKAYLQWNANGWLQLQNEEDGSGIRIKDDLTFSNNAWSSSYKIWNESNDGSGSGLDADTVDGIQAGAFVRADAEDSKDYALNINGGTANGANDATLYVTADNNSDWGLVVDKYRSSATEYGMQVKVGSSANHALRILGNGSEVFRVSGNGTVTAGGSNTVWHQGNDGSGSGLDADTLDGQQQSYYLNASNLNAGTVSTSRLPQTEGGVSIVGNFGQFEGHGTYNNFNTEPNYWGWSFVQGNTNAPNTSSSQWYRCRLSLGNGYGKGSDSGDYSLEMAIPRSGHTSAGGLHIRAIENGSEGSWHEVASKVGSNTVWHAGNDGSGSGLDADTLDGVQGASYLRSDAGDSFTGGTLTIAGGNDIRFSNGGWSGDSTKIQHHSNWLYLIGGSEGFIFRHTNGANRWQLNSSGHLYPSSNASYDIGASSYKINNGYFNWIYTDSGNRSSTKPNRFIASDDQWLRYYDGNYMRMWLGLSIRTNNYARQDSTSDTDYWVGATGWGTTSINNLMGKGNVFWDTWSNPSGQPSGTSHWCGFNCLHHTNRGADGTSNGGAHGWQMTMGAGSPALTYLRGNWSSSNLGTPTWYKVWNDANDGSGSGLDADHWDGWDRPSYLNQSVLTSSGPTFADVYVNSWLRNNDSTEGLYNTSTAQHWYSDNAAYYNLDGNGSQTGIRFRDNHQSTIRGYIYANNSNQIGFLDSGGSWRIYVNSNSNIVAVNHFIPASNNSYDLGTSSNRWRNLYINDLQLSNEGHSNDVDGTWGDWTLQEGEDTIFMINNRNGKRYKMALQEV